MMDGRARGRFTGLLCSCMTLSSALPSLLYKDCHVSFAAGWLSDNDMSSSLVVVDVIAPAGMDMLLTCFVTSISENAAIDRSSLPLLALSSLIPHNIMQVHVYRIMFAEPGEEVWIPLSTFSVIPQ